LEVGSLICFAKARACSSLPPMLGIIENVRRHWRTWEHFRFGLRCGT
jgi:hypothetical protein